MRKRSKEINIFSMSALDLFASALGAFILITIVLFPFFPNTGDSPERVAQVREEMSEALASAQNTIESLQQQLAECQSSQQSISDLQSQLQSCQAELEQTFVLVVISWSTGDDVDLHIIDPRGNEYYYDAETFPGSDAALEEDTTNGPGNEIWLSPAAMEGDYEIYVNMYSKNDDNPASVRASLLHKDGRIVLDNTNLTADGQKPLIARFTVNSEGTVIVR